MASKLAEVNKVEVWLMQRGGLGHARRISVFFEDRRYLPFDLDTARDETAMEWCVLDGISCGPVKDYDREQWPPDLKARFDLRR